MLRACPRRRWKDGDRDTPVGPPPPQLLEVAPPAAPLARVVRTPRPSRPWVHLSMHDKAINKENAHMMHNVMKISQRNVKQGANMSISF